jgi:hypothetical protein
MLEVRTLSIQDETRKPKSAELHSNQSCHLNPVPPLSISSDGYIIPG